jgi:3-hydroxyisobutyrate dehydrogenase
MPRIGFIGIGLMGLPLCRRLLNAGMDLTIWNRHPDKCQPLVAQGAKQADTAHTLAQDTDVIFLCVSDTKAVEAIVCGEAGLLEAFAR